MPLISALKAILPRFENARLPLTLLATKSSGNIELPNSILLPKPCDELHHRITDCTCCWYVSDCRLPIAATPSTGLLISFLGLLLRQYDRYAGHRHILRLRRGVSGNSPSSVEIVYWSSWLIKPSLSAYLQLLDMFTATLGTGH